METGTVAYLNEAKALCGELFPDRVFPNVGRSPVWFGRRDKVLAEGRKAIVDFNNDNLFAIASNEYKLVRHEEIVKQVHDACLEIPEYGIPEMKISLPYSGAKMILDVKFPEMMKDIKVGDTIVPKISVRSSYDLQWKLRSDGGLYRVICSNGAMAPVKGKAYSYINRHVSSLDLNLMIDTIKEGLILFSEQSELWKKWAEAKISNEVYSEIWEALPFSPAEKGKMEELPETGSKLFLPAALQREELTLWDMHSVVTQFVTHNIESENRKADLEPQVAKVFDNVYWNRMNN
jgi:hypothetical protein